MRYRIKDLEVLTGIKAHTLRIWEKRYNLLTPQRTETKIRVYTSDDLIKLLNVSILYNKGLKISKIAELSENEISDTINRLYNFEPCRNSNVILLIQSIIQLKCSRFDELLTNVIDRDGLEETYYDTVTCFLNKIMSLWKCGKISSVQKHYVFNLIRQKIIVETGKFPIKEKDYFDAVLFTPEWESEDINLLFYNYALIKKNCRTLYLGAKFPIANLKKMLSETHPKSLVLSVFEEKENIDFRQYLKNLQASIKLPVYLDENLMEKYQLSEYKSVFSIKDLI